MPVTEAAFFHKNRPKVKNVKVSLTEKLRNFYANKCCFYDSQVKKKNFHTHKKSGKMRWKVCHDGKDFPNGFKLREFRCLGIQYLDLLIW